MPITAVDAKAELARRARIELERRRGRPDFKAAVVAALRAELFPQQLAVIDDPSPLIALCCSRRAGKSEMAARMIAIALIQCGHNEACLFAARTLMRARQVIWPLLAKINDTYGLGWRMSEHVGMIVTPDGGVFMLLGCDDSNAIEKVRGSKYRVAFADEAATYEHLLERLVVDCLEPGCLDFDPPGRIILAGTPGYSRAGFWFEAATGAKPGWKSYYWTIFDNPMLKNIPEKLKAVREAHEWSEDDPTYRREYLGHWVADDSTLVYSVAEKRNSCQLSDLPAPPYGLSFEAWVRDEWLVTVAADVGYTDAFAVCAIGSPPGCKEMYVLEVQTQTGLRAEEQAMRMHEFRQKYRPARTVVDAGGQGKLVHQEFNHRYGKLAGGPAMPARKMGKVEAIGMMNSDLRAGKVKAVLPAAAPVFKEWCELPWATDAKDKVHPAYDNHASDAVFYAWREHCSFMTKPLPAKKTAEDIEREGVERRMAEARKKYGPQRR